MSDHPLYVALIWHMHQPFYRDLRTGEIALPWVRLHAAKDYLHMAEALARHPRMHLTINMVPSLTEQMLAWAAGKEGDVLVRLAGQRTWTNDEKRIILNLCYSISWDNIIRRYPRYRELLERRPQALANPEAFNEGDYRDLIGWFNLAWIDPSWLGRDPVLAGLVARGRDFTVAELAVIHTKQREIAATVLPRYRELTAAGQLEICASPYYHPILPLLVNSDVAQRPSPGLPIPQPAYCAPEDAAAQLRLAVEAHTQYLGAAPRGLWPSEGAVSPEILPLVHAAGFEWLASDEVILFRSLGRPLTRDAGQMVTDPRALYQPYRVLSGGELGPYMVFRDHELSDRIGFTYQHLPSRQAADDMIQRLLEIRRRINDPARPYLVSIVLDGENCWEHYENNGDAFLDAFYGALSTHGELRPVTVGEYLSAPERRLGGTLAKLASGSWIGGDFTTWIGDREHNTAWDALRRTREHLIAVSTALPAPEQDADSADAADVPDSASLAAGDGLSGAASSLSPVAQNNRDGKVILSAAKDLAWQALYAAEGSDWFWWYSHRNSSQQDAIFDRLFRHALGAVYSALGDESPEWLALPINQAPATVAGRPASGYVTPKLNAPPYPGEAWAAAAMLKPGSASTGTMQRAEGQIERLLVGYDTQALYLRLELRVPVREFEIAIYLGGEHWTPANQRPRARYADPDQAPAALALGWEIALRPGQAEPFLSRAVGGGAWRSVGPVACAVGERVLETTLPLAQLNLALEGNLRVLAVLIQGGAIVAQAPELEMGAVALRRFERG